MYSEITRSILVRVRPIYLHEHSSPKDKHYVWAYRVQIENNGGQPVQLLNRYWRIEDAEGNINEVRGPGVVGEHPVIAPGGQYEYGSFTHLPTTSGNMSGSYEMQIESGDRFDVAIPRFDLTVACRLVVSNEDENSENSPLLQ